MAIRDHEPIAAIATAPGRGGIGVVRISFGGKDAHAVNALMTALFGQRLIPRHASYVPFWTPMAKRWIGALACIFQRRALIPANTRLNCTDTAGRSCCNSSYNGALKPDRHSACVWPNLENLRAALF